MPDAIMANRHGNQRWWTRDRCLAALALAADELERGLPDVPCGEELYNVWKKGRFDLPPASRLQEHFGSIAQAWYEARVPMKLLNFDNVDWSARLRSGRTHHEYLLEHAGKRRLSDIAAALGRSYGGVRRRLNDHGIRARDARGFVSAQQVAEQFGCPLSRVFHLLHTGALPAKKAGRNRGDSWRIDPAALDAVRAQLEAPRRERVAS